MPAACVDSPPPGRTAPVLPLLARQLLRFGAVGLVGTAAYLAVFLVLRAGLDAQPAGAAARVLVAAPTTWLNSRFTFASRVSVGRLLAGSLALLAVGLLVTAAALLLMQVVVADPSRAVEVLTVALANLLAAAVRFLLLRAWLSPRRTPRRPLGELMIAPALLERPADTAAGPAPAGPTVLATGRLLGSDVTVAANGPVPVDDLHDLMARLDDQWDVRRRRSDLHRIGNRPYVMVPVSPVTLLLVRRTVGARGPAGRAGAEPGRCRAWLDPRHGRVALDPPAAAAAVRLAPAVAVDVLADFCLRCGSTAGYVRVGDHVRELDQAARVRPALVPAALTA